MLNKTALGKGGFAISFGINSTFPNLDNNTMTWETDEELFGEGNIVFVARESRVEIEGRRGLSIMATYEYNINEQHLIIGRMGGHLNKVDVGYFHLKELVRDDFEVSVYTLNLDLLAGRRLGNTNLNSPFLLGGMRINIPYNLDSKENIKREEINEELQRFNLDAEIKSVASVINYGIVAGLGYDLFALNTNLRIMAEYYYSLSNFIGENSHRVEGVSGEFEYLNLSNNNLKINHIMLSIGIKL